MVSKTAQKTKGKAKDQKKSKSTKSASSRNRAPQRMPAHRGPPPGEWKKPKKPAPEVDDEPLGLNEELVEKIASAERQFHEAILVVAREPDLAASLSDPAAHPRFLSMEGKGEFLTLDRLCVLASAGAGPDGPAIADPQGEAGALVAWPKFVDTNLKVTAKRGRAQRKVPAADAEKWLRGDPSVLRDRQATLPADDTETLMIGERNGTKHYVRKRKTHDFEAEDYTVTMTEGQLAKFRGDMSTGRRKRFLDQKMRLKKEVDEYPGDEHRSEEMSSLMGIILASSDKDAEDAP